MVIQTAPRSTVRLARGLGWFSLGLGLAELAATGSVADLVGLPRQSPRRGWLRALGARELATGAGILANRESPGWMWARVGGDAMDLGFLGTALGERGARRNRLLLALGAVAGVAALDLYCAAGLRARPRGGDGREEWRGSAARETTTIAAPVETIYAFWRDFRNLPRFMEHLLAVEVLDERRSRWTAAVPAGPSAEWEAEIVEDRPNEFIAWRSTADAALDNRGSVAFVALPESGGTEVVVELRYTPSGNRLGRMLGKLLGDDPARQVRSDLRTLRRLLEVREPVRSDSPA
jgi:uncharacterized membrane protein